MAAAGGLVGDLRAVHLGCPRSGSKSVRIGHDVCLQGVVARCSRIRIIISGIGVTGRVVGGASGAGFRERISAPRSVGLCWLISRHPHGRTKARWTLRGASSAPAQTPGRQPPAVRGQPPDES